MCRNDSIHLPDPTPFPLVSLTPLLPHHFFLLSLFSQQAYYGSSFLFQIILHFLPRAMCLMYLQLSLGHPSAPRPLWLIGVWVCACCSKIWTRNGSKQAYRRYLLRVTAGVLKQWHQLWGSLQTKFTSTSTFSTCRLIMYATAHIQADIFIVVPGKVGVWGSKED